MVVRRMDEAGAEAYKEKNRRNLDQHHRVVGAGRFANAAYQHHRQQQHNDERGNIEAEVPALRKDVYLAREIQQAQGQIRG